MTSPTDPYEALGAAWGKFVAELWTEIRSDRRFLIGVYCGVLFTVIVLAIGGGLR